jgi:hypothetical protein
MLTFDPMIEGVSVGNAGKGLYHGAGITTDFLVGQHFKRFGNAGFKIRPAGLVVPLGDRLTLDLSFNLRIYPRRFTAEDFGVPGSPEDGVEVVRSILGTISF